jgi:hypothetical protein
MCNKEQAHDCIFNQWILCISCIANYNVIVGGFMHGFFASRIIVLLLFADFCIDFYAFMYGNLLFAGSYQRVPSL